MSKRELDGATLLSLVYRIAWEAVATSTHATFTTVFQGVSDEKLRADAESVADTVLERMMKGDPPPAMKTLFAYLAGEVETLEEGE